MIPDIKEINFPKKNGKQYATLTHATPKLDDMGEKNITTQVKIDGEIVPDFSFDWAVEFQGEKYIMPLRIPAGSKDNESLKSQIDLTFQHWAIYQLKRWPFVTIQQIAAGTYLPDEEVATVQLNLKDFCILFGQVLEYYYGDTITIDLNPAWQYKQEATTITISHTKIWNVLIDAFHDKYGVRWEIKAASDNSNTVKGGERYVIRIGYPTTEVDHIFEYGFEGGLLKVERQVQSEEIRNMLKGRGGETNIPFRYFKDTDPNNPDFRPDPDWVEELANIYFPNLMGATFRSYIQGWKAAHISKYPGYTAVGESNAYAPWAYRKGYTDTKFSPVEFVADEITISPTTQDKQVEILPGYSPYVKEGSSLDKYGPLPDTLDNNDEIYPTLQGTGLDIAVDVEQIESDDVAGSVENDAKGEDKTYPNIIKRNVPQGHATASDASKRTYFTVPSGKNAIIEGHAGATAYNPKNHEDKSALIAELDYTIKVFNAVTGAQHSASGIPAGNWYFTVEYSFNNTDSEALNVTLSFNSVKITSATPDDKWRNTFDIWVKNIWSSTKLSTETNEQYAERVWKPVLGDREKNTAKVVFTSGALAISEDYEFTIVDFPVPDTSKTWQEKDDSGVVIATHTSHWRITLAKSDAELEATGLYVPSKQKQGKAGDRFVFIGTEMTHVPYVVDAEIRLDDWKKDQLGEVKEIKPTAVVTTDRVRLNNEGKPDALINQLRVGNSLRLFDKRFFNEPGKAYETLYLQSITYTYREPTSDDAALNPDVEIVLGNEYSTSANPVSMMQGEISALQKQVGSISNIQQIVRAVGDKLYLRKDGISDRSLSPTQFFSLLTSGDFRAGLVGGAGWGFYKDENGNWVLEADRVNVRQEMQVNTLVINQAEGRGGMEIDTAAYIDGVTRVVETDNGYVCYFDQKGGSVANLFHVDDVAYCNRWTPENAQLKFYKRRVTAVGADNITLSKTDVNGTGIPAEGDNIIHFGNYTDATRQYVKVRDVVGGGYERYIEALNSVNAEGVEYYFIGKQAGESRWFVGNKDLVPYSGAGDGSYIEYINRKFNLNNVSLSVNTTIGDKTIEEYIKQVSPPVKQEDIEGFVNAIVDPKLEGIQNQIDGVIESFFGFGAPTPTNYPANEWTTDEAKKAHANDTYTDKTEYVDDTTTPTAGQSWKWQYTSPTDYGWIKIADSDAVKALLDAAKAQDTADSKRRVFTAQPVPPYDEGDMWVNATYPSDTTAETRDPAKGKYFNDILRCNSDAHKATGTAFAIGDWGLSSNYTDDTKADEALNKIAGYEYLKNALLPENPTQITGGLIMSTLISLGYTDEAGLRHTLAGMNGSWVDTLGGRTIASWYGGEMMDLFDAADVRITPLPANAAKSLLRMDGSAYFSGGNIGFRADGSGWLGNDTNGIKFGTDGSMVFGNGIKINLSSGEEGLAQTLESVVNLVNNLSTLLKPVDAQGNELQWSQAANAFALLSEVHFGSKGDITAYAAGGLSGAAPATSLADLTDVELGSLAAGDVIKWDASLGKWVNGSAPAGGLDEDSLAAYLTANNYVTSAALGNYVTVDTEQTISGQKTFSSAVRIGRADDTGDHNAIYFYGVTGDNPGSFNHTWIAERLWGGTESSELVLFKGNDFGNHTDAATVSISGPDRIRHIAFGHLFQVPTEPMLGLPSAVCASTSLKNVFGMARDRVTSYVDLYATSFIKTGGISSQFLKADGSVDGNNYIKCYDGNVKLEWLWGSNPTHIVGFESNSSTAMRVYDGNALRNFTNAVNKAGDTMTGDLYTPHLLVGITQSEVLNSWPIYNNQHWHIIVGGKPTHSGGSINIMRTADSQQSYISWIHKNQDHCGIGAASNSNEIEIKNYLGGINIASTGAFTYNGNTIWHAGNDGSGSGLDADLLDGYHGGDFFRTGKGYISDSYFNGAEFQNLAPGVYTHDHGGASAMLVSFGNQGASASSLELYTRYDNGWDIFYRKKIDSNRFAGGWNTFITNLNIGSYNAGSATVLQNTRYLWGQAFNGGGDVNGTFYYNNGDGTLKIYGIAPQSYGYETVAIQTAFDAQDPETSYYPYTYPDRNVLTLQPRGGRVGIGLANPSCMLHVNGTILANGDVTAYSDARLKSDICPLTNRGFIEPKTYIKDGKRSIGFLAQDVMAIYPELVTDTGGADHWLALNYGNLVAVLEAQIIDHEERIKRLEARA